MMWKEKEEKEEEKEQYESCNTLTPSERGSDGRPQLGEMEGERCPPERAFTTFLTRKQDNMFVCLR